jgi:DNA-binding MarR family transcriptional regulator
MKAPGPDILALSYVRSSEVNAWLPIQRLMGRAMDDANQAGDALRRLVDLASHRSGIVFALMNDAAVTLPQVLLMSRVERFGSASLSDLAEVSATSLAALSQMIERLVQQGLLSRTEDAIDRRRKAVRLTRGAQSLLRKLRAARSADYELGLGSASQELRLQLVNVIERVIGDIEDTRGRSGRSAGEVLARASERA